MTTTINDKERLRVLLIGPLPPPYCGTSTLLEYLVELLKEDSTIEACAINTRGIRGEGLRGVVRFGRLLWRMFACARKSDVVTLHCSTTALHIIGITVLLIARLARRPLIIRKFAGDDYRTTLGAMGSRLAEFVLRHTDLYLAETKCQVNAARERGVAHVEWYPNSRPIPEALPPIVDDGRPCRRFVYIGRVCEAKGMHILAKAAKGLPNDVSVDVYGPWSDDLERNVFDDSPNITYHGVLKPEEIVPTMLQYDVSLLPTHHRGEGYPGAILESYFAGLPVIAARWQALPEIVDESVGILVEPKNANALLQGMLRLVEDKLLFQKLRSNTQAKAEFFSAEHWGEQFIACCREVCGKQLEATS